MKKTKLLKTTLILMSINLFVSCTNTTTPSTPTNQDISKNNSQSSANTSSRDESKKPEPFISGDNSSVKETSPSGDMYAGAPTAEIIGGSERPAAVYATSMPSAAATSMPGTAYSGDIGTASGSGSASGYSTTPVNPVKRLSAGDTDDNAKFSEYLSYLNSNSSYRSDDVIKLDVSDRYIISVKDKNGNPVSNANVKISSSGNNVFTGKTYSNGKVLFMPLSIKSQFSEDNCGQQQECSGQNINLNSDFKVTVEKNNEVINQNFAQSKENKNWDIQLSNSITNQNNINLDLTFLVDATGSMGDEIASIQKTIKDISSRIKQISSDKTLNIRYSLISYKDKGDSYRVKRYDFTTNLEAYQEILNELTAGGGGDYKEGLNEALDNAVNKITWTNDKEAIRLIFLIADAPPHLDYSDDIKYPASINSAVKQGIKIYPVAASGLSSIGEYVFRQLAQFTYAKFLFLTYGGDAQTPGTTPHNVGPYNETNLDDLVVNIVKEEVTQTSVIKETTY